MVKTDRRSEPFHESIRGFRKTSAPGLFLVLILAHGIESAVSEIKEAAIIATRTLYGVAPGMIKRKIATDTDVTEVINPNSQANAVVITADAVFTARQYE